SENIERAERIGFKGSLPIPIWNFLYLIPRTSIRRAGNYDIKRTVIIDEFRHTIGFCNIQMMLCIRGNVSTHHADPVETYTSYYGCSYPPSSSGYKCFHIMLLITGSLV